MPKNLTFEGLTEMVKALNDPNNDCDTCGGGGLPGTIAPIATNGDASHCFVECCGSCEVFHEFAHGDQAAAEAIAAHFPGRLNVRKRYDDETLQYWHPFLTRPGSSEDFDSYCIGADKFGTFPTREVRVPHDG